MSLSVDFPELPKWSFTATERSASNYQLVASREGGASVVITGSDYEALLDRGRHEAALMELKVAVDHDAPVTRTAKP